MGRVLEFIPRAGSLLFEGQALEKQRWLLQQMFEMKQQFEAATTDTERDGAHEGLMALQLRRAEIEGLATRFAETCEEFDGLRNRLVAQLSPGTCAVLARISTGLNDAVVMTGRRQATTFRCSDFDFFSWKDRKWSPYFGTFGNSA